MGGVGDFIQDEVIDPIKKVGREADDFVNEEIPGVEQIFAATEAILNVGSDMTQEQREESQSVVVGAIIITQIASMASISVSQSSSRKFNK